MAQLDPSLTARQFSSHTKSSADTDADVSMELSESTQDLGWKLPEGKKKRRKSAQTTEATEPSNQDSAAEKRRSTTVGLLGYTA